MPLRRVRILLGKIGEGHKETQLNLAKRFGEAGFEVIYTDLQEPEAIVRSAIQESVDHTLIDCARAHITPSKGESD